MNSQENQTEISQNSILLKFIKGLLIYQRFTNYNLNDIVDLAKFNDKYLVPLLKKLGIYAESETSQLEIDLEKYFKLNLRDCNELPNVQDQQSHFDTDLVIKEWLEQNSEIEQVIPYYYLASGEICPKSYIIIKNRPIISHYIMLLKYKDSLISLTMSFNSYFCVWDINIIGPHCNLFYNELSTKIEQYLIAKHKGKIIDHNLKEIDIKIYQKNELIFPPKQSKRINQLIKAFKQWQKTDSIVNQWGCFLIGRPGTGKTSLGGLLAGIKNKATTLIYWPASQIGNEQEIKNMFRYAHLFAPAVLIIDDIDLIAKNRDEYAEERALTAALMENLDGLRETGKIFSILITNDPSKMEFAITNRAGRIYDKIIINNFKDCFTKLLTLYAQQYKLNIYSNDIVIAVNKFTIKYPDFEGLTPDEVKNICQRAYLIHGKYKISAKMLYEIIELVYESFYNLGLNNSCL